MRNKKGQLSLQVLIFGVVSIIIISGFALWASSFLKFSLRDFNKTLAFSISEAGIEYYRWHLAHSPLDFQDGTGGPGPYVHNYYDKNGILLGQFSLEITSPPVGSTIVDIKSTSQLTVDSSIQKIIKVKMGYSSLTKYAVLANDNLRFGSGTLAYGPIHSNGGIRFDGVAYNTVYSAQASYDDPDHSGGNEFGVHTHVSPVDPLPPTAVPSRPDVFAAGRQFPVPAVDFAGLTQSLAQIKSDAQTAGRYFASSTVAGYHIVLKTDGTFDFYKVTSLYPKIPSCNNSLSEDGWGTWSIDTEVFLQNYAFPANGLIFVEDDLWVSGQINKARLTIAVGRFPEVSETNANISITDNILYTNYDGQDALGLIAQNNITVGLVSQDNLRLDTALVAKNGRVGRYYYRPPTSGGGGNEGCGQWNVRSSVTTYGTLASNHNYSFSFSDSTGYLIQNLNYDSNMVYNPPPSFPVSSYSYQQLLWDEVK